MADKPILFSGPMVRALLDGRKTQTRRIMKPQPKFGFEPWLDESNGQWMQSGYGERGDDLLHVPIATGDRLWVRETWQKSGLGWGNELPVGKAHYRATDEGEWKPYWGNWRSSIHMPRWASRLTLVVTDVRVQQLQDISEEDARAEGVRQVAGMFQADKPDGMTAGGTTARAAFALLWNSINGPGSWDRNDWVAAYTFTVHQTNIDAMKEAA